MNDTNNNKTAGHRINPKTLAWMERFGQRSDQLRAEWARPRVRRYIDVCDLLRSERRFWTVPEIQDALDLDGRTVRRTLDHLEAARLVELQRGGRARPGAFGGHPTRARYHKRPLS
jgi:DNA-binding transcriptional ArsR family regulator